MARKILTHPLLMRLYYFYNYKKKIEGTSILEGQYLPDLSQSKKTQIYTHMCCKVKVIVKVRVAQQ